MLQITAQLPFSAKFFSTNSPPPKKSSNRVREYLRLDEVLDFGQKKTGLRNVYANCLGSHSFSISAKDYC